MYLPVQALTDHAVLEERTRLAREIHDTLAQQLTGIVLELEAADTLLNRGSERRAKSSVEKARELARGALQEARRSVWNLRPAPLSATGLVAAIGHEVEAWEERTGIPARFQARAVPRAPTALADRRGRAPPHRPGGALQRGPARQARARRRRAARPRAGAGALDPRRRGRLRSVGERAARGLFRPRRHGRARAQRRRHAHGGERSRAAGPRSPPGFRSPRPWLEAVSA